MTLYCRRMNLKNHTSCLTIPSMRYYFFPSNNHEFTFKVLTKLSIKSKIVLIS